MVLISKKAIEMITTHLPAICLLKKNNNQLGIFEKDLKEEVIWSLEKEYMKEGLSWDMQMK